MNVRTLAFALLTFPAVALAQAPHPVTPAEQAKVESLIHSMTLEQKLDYIGGNSYAAGDVEVEVAQETMLAVSEGQVDYKRQDDEVDWQLDGRKDSVVGESHVEWYRVQSECQNTVGGSEVASFSIGASRRKVGRILETGRRHICAPDFAPI